MQQEQSRILEFSPQFKLVQFRKSRVTCKGRVFLFCLLLSLFALFLFQINYLFNSTALEKLNEKQQISWTTEEFAPPPQPQISKPVEDLNTNNVQSIVNQINQNVQQNVAPSVPQPVRAPIIVEEKSFNLPAGYKSLINSTTKIENMKVLFPRLEVQQYSKQNTGKSFAQIPSFTLNIGPSTTSTINGIDYENYGAFTNIQVGSKLDFTNISNLVNFTELQKAMKNSIAHQVLSFKRDESLQVVREKITFSGKQNENEIMRAVNSIGGGQQNLGFYTNLAKNGNNYHLRQQQFYYYDKKYKISENQKETPICIYATGYKIFSKNRYKAFFESLDRQNYSNFHIVYVDDNSPDQSAYLVFQYLHELKTRLTNRIKIIHNTQHLGALGNIFFWVKKYCNDEDIVAIIDGDDSIIGTQNFQLLTSIYKDPNKWYVYTKYIQHHPDKGIYRHGVASNYFRGSTSGYRTFYPHWFTSHMRTFRKQVFNAVPLEHIIQYHYNPKNGSIYPNLYGSSADRFQVYSNIELVGNDRLVFLDEYIYLYDAAIGMTSSRCYHQHQYYDEQKSRIKTPLLKLNELGQKKAIFTQNYSIPPTTLSELQRRYQNYKNCLRKL